MTGKHHNIACRGYGTKMVADTSRALNFLLREEDAGFRTSMDSAGSGIKVRYFTPTCPECGGLEKGEMSQAARTALSNVFLVSLFASAFLLRGCGQEIEKEFGITPGNEPGLMAR